MRWLIVEDALRDRRGHWFEYLNTFAKELRTLGDDVTILADSGAEPFLVEQLHVRPVLPASIWHRMGDSANAWQRYLRVPVHAWQTYRALKAFLRKDGAYDLIFVPTVLVHHLLGWTWLIKGVLKKSSARVLLFFPNTPVQLDLNTNEPAWQPAPTAKLFRLLIQSLHSEVKLGRVILGAETHPMCAALTQLTGVPFTYLPHPVQPDEQNGKPKAEGEKAGADFSSSEGQHALAGKNSDGIITFGSYGSARHEKGSEILVAAVEEFCRRYPDSRAQFVLQSVDGDTALWKRLEKNPKVRLIPNYFADGEYARQLACTDALVLPYRRSSYALRVSRVVIEAMVHGMPVVTTKGSTLQEQTKEFGAAICGEDDNVESFVRAIHEMDQNFHQLKALAENRMAAAQNHFSAKQFRRV